MSHTLLAASYAEGESETGMLAARSSAQDEANRTYPREVLEAKRSKEGGIPEFVKRHDH